MNDATPNTATPQDTYDHTIGAGALTFSWWLTFDQTNVSGGVVADDWTVTITAGDGTDDTTATLDHAKIIATARKIIGGGGGKYVSDAAKRECRALIFDPDDCDFDACTADELLQVAVLGEVIFG